MGNKRYSAGLRCHLSKVCSEAAAFESDSTDRLRHEAHSPYQLDLQI